MAEFLHSVFAQTYTDWHLYVYDNDSEHCIQNLLSKYDSSRYEFINLIDNYGFALSNNLAIRKAFYDGCDAVIIINNDTEFEADLFAGLVAEVLLHNALIVAPKMLYYPDTNLVWYGGGYFDPRQALKNVHLGMDEVDRGQYNVSSWQDFAPMCCVLIQRDAFDKIGYLDENYFIYYEDADWMYRAKLANIPVWYSGTNTIYHKVSSITGGAKSDFTVYHATRGKVYFIKKFYTGFKRYYWLTSYFAGMFIGLLIKRYSWKEFKTKLRAFFS